MKQMQEGQCHICGRYGELTYEHIPPESALNNKRAYIYSGEEALKRYKGEKSRYVCMQQGMGRYTLCKECNNNTGAWYVPKYSQIAREVAHSLHELKQIKHGVIFEQSFHNFPTLAFVKQILVMFCSLLPIGKVKSLCLDELLLDPHKQIETPSFDLRLYCTPADVGKLMIGPSGLCIQDGEDIKTLLVSDIGAYPFGFILNMTPEYSIGYGTSIVDFLKTDYDKGYDMKWTLPYLERTSSKLPLPLQFKPCDKKEGWIQLGN